MNRSGKLKPRTFGPDYDARVDRLRLRTQFEVIRDVMLSAAVCGAWLTLRELGRITGYGEASISAQLRHLRKPQFGGYAVEKRRRGEPTKGVWEYRLRPGPPAPAPAEQLELLESCSGESEKASGETSDSKASGPETRGSGADAGEGTQ